MVRHLSSPRLPLRLFFAACLFSVCLVVPVFAQTPPGRVGLGGQIGDPSGLTLKLYERPGFAYEFLAAWDLNRFFFVNGHALYEQPIRDTPLRYYMGPGVLLGIRTRGPHRQGRNDLVVGLSGQFGVNFFVERFEVFLHLTPRLSVIPRTDGEIGGGIGIRYYF